MGTIWIRDFKGGLDKRRMPETLPGGTAILARDGHINSGGEFEQRAAFVPAYDLPAGLTVGLSAGRSGIYVFGDGPAPVMPRGVTYQRLQHPDQITPLFRVLSTDLFQQKIYAVAEFTDGTLYHFYDGVLVTDWQDGRARVSVQVTGGGPQAAVAATGSFTVAGGTASIVNTFADITLGGVSIIGAPVQHTGNNSTTAAAIAAAITALASNPNYSAAAVGAVVTITAAIAGTAPNGLLPVLTMTGNVFALAITAMSGGAAATVSRLDNITVNGVSICAPVEWDTSNEVTAAAVAAAINSYSSTPDYTATAVSNKVNILAADPGTAPNGFAVAFSPQAGFAVAPSAGVTLTNGLAPGVVFQSGTSVKTVGSKVYAAAGPNLNFSNIKAPTSWQTGGSNVGAGFIDMSTEAAGSEVLQAIEKYLQYIVVFAERVIQIWYVDPDPALNKPAQTLNNIGTLSPRSVTQFGDNDLFFLDESGVRSLKARDASNAASTTDIGSPIDPLIVKKLQTLTPLQRSEVVGLIEPSDGRFWIVFPDEIFVFSFFTGSKVSAWSTYTPAVDGEPFAVNRACVLKKKVYLRSGDKIYVFGGLEAQPAYDSTEPELWLPYLDANAPARKKEFKGLDVACEGEWVILAAMEPTNLNATDKVATVTKTTYNADKIPFEHEATHVSLRFKGVGAGPKKLGSAAIHYKGDQDED